MTKQASPLTTTDFLAYRRFSERFQHLSAVERLPLALDANLIDADDYRAFLDDLVTQGEITTHTQQAYLDLLYHKQRQIA